MKKIKVNKEREWKRSDVLSVLAIIISIISIGICLTQTGIQRRQLESQLKENQPIFKLTYDYRKLSNDSIDNTKVLYIKNVGKEAKSINKIDKETFIELRVSNSEDVKSFYIPVIGFYGTSYNLDGYVKMDQTPNNNLAYYKFYKECLEESNNSVYFNSILIEFVTISYTDIYGENHVEYFEGETICSKEYYESVVKKSKDVFGIISYDINDLKLDDILKYIKDNQKK